MQSSRRRVNASAGNGPEEVRLIRLAKSDAAFGQDARVSAHRRQGFGERRIYAPVHEAKRLKEVRAYKHAATRDVLVDLEHLKTIVLVERSN
jgi:hypothetical protein